MSDSSQGTGWWEASDGKWYPPESHPNYKPPPPPPTLPPAAHQQLPPATPAQPSYAQSATVPHAKPRKTKKAIWKRWWFVGLVIFVGIIVIASVAAPSDDEASGTLDDHGATPGSPDTTIASAPVVTESAPPPEPASNLTPAQQNAVRSAENYLDLMGFSRQGLIDQLEFEQYSTGDATAAVDSLNVDWNAEAAESARNYLELMGFSCQGLIDQLSSSAGDKYTVAQATYGATEAGIC